MPTEKHIIYGWRKCWNDFIIPSDPDHWLKSWWFLWFSSLFSRFTKQFIAISSVCFAYSILVEPAYEITVAQKTHYHFVSLFSRKNRRMWTKKNVVSFWEHVLKLEAIGSKVRTELLKVHWNSIILLNWQSRTNWAVEMKRMKKSPLIILCTKDIVIYNAAC